MRPGKRKKDKTDRQPPNNLQAEQAVIGHVLDHPEAFLDCSQRWGQRQVFHDVRNQMIWAAACRAQRNGGISPTAVYEHLDEKSGEILKYLAELPQKCLNEHDFRTSLDIVWDKFQMRRQVEVCQQIIDRTYEGQGDVEELFFANQSDLAELIEPAAAEGLGTRFHTADLYDFNIASDHNSVLGNRWACRGGKILIIGPSGVGKSSLEMQMAVLWALGRPFCGIRPARPLRSLLIGDENDQGDLAEMFQGVINFLGLNPIDHPDEFDLLQQNLEFSYCPAQSGPGFLLAVERELQGSRFDLAFLDPLVSYANVDITRQDGAAIFLRQGLSRIALKTGIVWVVIHHTPKTSRDPRAKSNWTASDYQYAGAGSYDLPGWARAVMTLQQATDDAFRLIISKRGSKAGACHPDGSPTNTIWLRHAPAEKGIYWQQIDKPEEKPVARGRAGRINQAEQVAASNLHGFLAGCIDVPGEGLNVISKRLESWLAKEGQDLSNPTCKRIIPLLVASRKLIKTPELLYRKGPNA